MRIDHALKQIFVFVKQDPSGIFGAGAKKSVLVRCYPCSPEFGIFKISK
jgi:hypothetical protein